MDGLREILKELGAELTEEAWLELCSRVDWPFVAAGLVPAEGMEVVEDEFIQGFLR